MDSRDRKAWFATARKPFGTAIRAEDLTHRRASQRHRSKVEEEDDDEVKLESLLSDEVSTGKERVLRWSLRDDCGDAIKAGA